MCNKRNKSKIEVDGRKIKIDSCMVPLIRMLNHSNIEVYACCCGHGKYPKTIIGKFPKIAPTMELLSLKIISRKRKFYFKDKQGFYYIPEVVK